MNLKTWIIVCIVLGFSVAAIGPSAGKEDTVGDISTTPQKLSLKEAVMCEGIKDYEPVNKSIVFSLDIGKIYGFTSFDHVPEKTVVYHSWYRRDRLITTKRLTLQPPQWSIFSSIQLREADKGPWRLEVKDQDRKVLRIVKFSVTD